jgi:aminoglycoside phosphotransferase (APT) family kinase protein
MPAQDNYDPELVRKRLARWIADRIPGAEDVEVGPITAPGETGFSSETLLIDATWTAGGEGQEERWVIRSRPRQNTVFPDYDLHAQYLCMQHVARASDVPVPRVRWWEPDTDVLGEPFYVMDRVEGLVPSDSPPYTVVGFLAEATAEQQARLYRAEVDILARLHAIDWYKAGFDFLSRPEFGKPGLTQQFEYYRWFLRWAGEGREQPTIEAAFDWLENNRPAGADRVVLNWGDARPSNIMVRDFEPVAVLDWEMATLGPPEVDVAWFVYLNRFLSEGVGAAPLPGFLDADDTKALYEELSGTELGDLHYYQVWAGVRFAIIFLRIIQRMERQGTLVPGWTEQNNICTQFLAEVAGLPTPQ